PQYVIVGNGVAGVTTARTIDQTHPGAEIHLYAAEPYPYYARPRLWEYLAGETALEGLTFYPDSWYEQRGIRVHLGQRVVGLDPAAHQVTLASGVAVTYERLVLATGGNSFVPPIQGAQKAGVFTLRHADDARAMSAYAEGRRRAIAIGGGLLGLETARALRLRGLEVTVLEMAPYLLPRQLDAQGAGLLTKLITEMGMTVQVGVATEAILGDERAEGVALKGGETIPAEMVLISAGVRSDTALAREAGLTVNRGVVVDEFLRTSAPDIYAVGDAAEFAGQVYGIIPAAIEQGRVAGAHAAGGAPSPYTGTVPANTLKIVGIDLTAVGVINPEGGGYLELLRMDEDRRRYKKFVIQDGRLVGAILLGQREGVGQVTQLIAKKADVSAHAGRLLDDDFDWKAI
ncbi:MAG: NAD(P)/FAD-dependent oxidoreductase, partial [Chloroflexi bacterium]|nr:NAD(P)/FAD-dependent oxidoreductase [Chloroflexota bacterium]